MFFLFCCVFSICSTANNTLENAAKMTSKIYFVYLKGSTLKVCPHPLSSTDIQGVYHPLRAGEVVRAHQALRFQSCHHWSGLIRVLNLQYKFTKKHPWSLSATSFWVFQWRKGGNTACVIAGSSPCAIPVPPCQSIQTGVFLAAIFFHHSFVLQGEVCLAAGTQTDGPACSLQSRNLYPWS